MKRVLLTLIKVYQSTLSPDHGWPKLLYPFGYCKFFPSCSEYCYYAIEQYGSFRGSLLGIKRILNCNPISRGGYDPVK